MKKLEKKVAAPESAAVRKDVQTAKPKTQPAKGVKATKAAQSTKKAEDTKKKKSDSKVKLFKVPKAKQIRMRRTFKKTSAEKAKEGDLYKRCRKLRRAMGMTQGEFGDALGTYQTMISLVERRKITLNVRLLRLFERLESAYLNGELEELAPGEEYDPAADGDEFYREAYKQNEEDLKKQKQKQRKGKKGDEEEA
ncbi:MAG: helix-turn-helix transcriptional regulator [Kiritimatiellae bacterium]|nr:helix-turn-helix transcriptional regulator [Kiritimatiellia bacterium]